MIDRKPTFVGVSALILLLHPWSAMAQSPPGSAWPGPWHMWSGGWGFWWIFPLLMCGAMVFLCALFIARGPWSTRGRYHDAARSALALLSERFARGDISRQEFEEKKAILERRA